MNERVRRQALVATAHVAMGAAALAACGGNQSEARPVEMQPGAPYAPSKIDPPPPVPPQKACDDVIASAFPNRETWQPVGGRTPELARCCGEKVVKQRYDPQCCTAIDWEAKNEDVNRACSPWGPPVPPRMAWRPTSSRAAAATSASSKGSPAEA